MRQLFKKNGALWYGIQSLKRCQCIVSAQNSAGNLELSRGARNRVGIGLLYRPARLRRLVESIPGLLNSLKIPSQQPMYIILSTTYLTYLREII
jgi:hypothetical protein